MLKEFVLPLFQLRLISVWKQENVSSKPFKTKVGQVPVFVRPPKCTSTKSTQNSFHLEDENFKANECSVNENYDMLVVDWKNMSTIKISNISELKLHDLLQFKVSVNIFLISDICLIMI